MHGQEQARPHGSLTTEKALFILNCCALVYSRWIVSKDYLSSIFCDSFEWLHLHHSVLCSFNSPFAWTVWGCRPIYAWGCVFGEGVSHNSVLPQKEIFCLKFLLSGSELFMCNCACLLYTFPLCWRNLCSLQCIYIITYVHKFVDVYLLCLSSLACVMCHGKNHWPRIWPMKLEIMI
jgi:hypothetical protein